MHVEKQLKVMFVAADTSGPSYHDLFLPINYFHKFNLLQCALVTTLDQALASDADLISFQRQYLPEVLMFVRQAKAKGKVVMTICDDNVWKLPDGNPAKNIYVGDTLERYNAILKEVHAVTTSTPYLKKLVLPFNSNTYVHRNLVDINYPQFVSPGRDIGQEDTIRIGWHLTPHHADDYKIVESAIEKITYKYPLVRWIAMGWSLPIFEKLPRNRWEYYQFVPVDAFYPALASLDFDIGIAPLADNPFNWGKTHRKFSEYGILGIPSILSPVLPYLGLEEINCTLYPKTNDTKGWIEAITNLIEDTELRNTLLTNAYNWVIDNQNINTYIAERAQVYYDVWANVKGEDRQVVWDGDLRATERIQNLRVVPGVNDV